MNKLKQLKKNEKFEKMEKIKRMNIFKKLRKSQTQRMVSSRALPFLFQRTFTEQTHNTK